MDETEENWSQNVQYQFVQLCAQNMYLLLTETAKIWLIVELIV